MDDLLIIVSAAGKIWCTRTGRMLRTATVGGESPETVLDMAHVLSSRGNQPVLIVSSIERYLRVRCILVQKNGGL
jgi:hypothetical protein